MKTSGVPLCDARTTARTTETSSMARTEGAVRNSLVMRVRIKCGEERRYSNAGAAEFSAHGPSEFENSVLGGAVPGAVHRVAGAHGAAAWVLTAYCGTGHCRPGGSFATPWRAGFSGSAAVASLMPEWSTGASSSSPGYDRAVVRSSSGSRSSAGGRWSVGCFRSGVSFMALLWRTRRPPARGLRGSA